MTPLGEVLALWRYPVKSMQGERCDIVDVDARGVVGDRLYAVADADGRLASGKNTRRFRRIGGLIELVASSRGGVPEIRFPGGRMVRGDEPEIDAALSATLGQVLRLVRESDVPHHDAAPIHIISSASLQSLCGIAPEDIADESRFRPNIVIAAGGHEHEEAWLGRRLAVGTVELRVLEATERCAMVSSAQADLDEAPALLRHIADERDLCFGIYAEVLKPGTICCGDPVVDLDANTG